MEREKLNGLITQVNGLTYEDKNLLFQSVFSIGNLLTPEFSDKLVLVSLVSLVQQRMHEKDPSMTHLKVLTKITGREKDESSFYQFLESLAIIAKDFSYGTKKIDPCGLTTSQDIINKIKELLNTWMPF
ncbi:MAG: hypothetical protein ACOH2V_00935 [Candidatus Saccharimonadaceae bacterium]